MAKVLAIDFDGVMHNPGERDPGFKMGHPMPETKQAFDYFRLKGYRIIIHTVRAESEDGREAVRRWMKYFELPWDEITNIKPRADYYIDNKAIKFKTWRQVTEEIE